MPVLLLAVMVTSCGNPESDLKKAEQANTEQGYQDFIKRHPDSPLVAQAQTDLEKVVYEAAKRAGASSGFENFLSRFPKSPLDKQAQVDLETTEYDQAKRAGTTLAYEAFLNRFPNSTLTSQAQTDLETLEFNRAKQTATTAAYKDFLKRFAGTDLAKQAQAALEALEYTQAKQAGSVAVYEDFLARYPSAFLWHNRPKQNLKISNLRWLPNRPRWRRGALFRKIPAINQSRFGASGTLRCFISAGRQQQHSCGLRKLFERILGLQPKHRRLGEARRVDAG